MQHAARRERRRGVAVVVAGVVVAALGAACGGAPGKSASTASSAVASTPAPTATSSGPITLKILDADSDPGPNAEQKEFIKRYEAAHPNVTITRQSMPFNNFLNTVKLTLSSPNAPDVSDGNQGPQIDGALVKGGLIKPLTAYASKFGWDKIWTPTTLAPNTFSNDGTQFGTGTLWGISSRAEIVGVYYNKARLAKLGFQVPKTFADFEKILAASKAAGQPPFIIGDLDKYPGGHYLMTLADHYSDPDALRNWVFGRPGATFDTPAVRQAAAKLQEWAQKGYFEKGFNSVKDSDAQARFAKGEGLFVISGPWVNGGFVDGLKDGVGFFLLPPENEGDPVKATGSVSLPIHISAKTKNEATAADFLNYITSEEAANVILSHGDLPARPLESPQVDPNSSIASIVAAWRTTSQSPNLVPYMDWPTPTMFDTLMGGTQSLMAGQVTPQQFTKTVQADWAKYHKG
jgi:raffinose/stachyose/melibiose transport system substrate-binding protein